MKEKFVSIIIPCREIDKYTEECLLYCLSLNYKNFEIIILPDNAKKRKNSSKIRVIPTGKVKPAVKRNIGMKNARGEIYAFTDSDAYPEKDWIKNAVKYLENKNVGMVGGPNLTPKRAELMEHISGEILSMPIVSGFANIRYRTAEKQYVKELPSCNFIVKKEDAGQFSAEFLTAEDSKFCFDIRKKGKRLLYAPDVIVYHHRRNTMEGHLKQMWTYGRDIALLTKKEFSADKMYYTLPSLFVLFVFFGLIDSLLGNFSLIYGSIISIYFILMLAFSLRNSIEKTILIFFGSIMTHFAYGAGYIYGIFTKAKKTGLNKR